MSPFTRTLLFTTLLVFLVSSGCLVPDSDPKVVRAPDAGSDAGERAGVPLEDYAAEMADAYCSAAFRCCRQSESKVLAQKFASVDMSSKQQCRRTLRSTIVDRFMAEMSKGVEAGRAAYDPQRAATCISDVRSLSCSDIPSNEPAGDSKRLRCREAFTPKVAPGGRCNRGLECRDGYCDLKVEDGKADVCVRYRKVGAACQSTDFCAKGAYCDDSSNVCRRKKSLGSNCKGANACRSNLCAATGQGGAVCKPKRRAGEECFAGSMCKSGLCNAVSDSQQVCLGAPACTGK